MTSRSGEERLADCVAAVFPFLSRDEIQRAGSASVAAWDSLAMVTLVSLIEEEFSIQFSLDDYQLASSYQLLLDHVRQLDEQS